MLPQETEEIDKSVFDRQKEKVQYQPIISLEFAHPSAIRTCADVIVPPSSSLVASGADPAESMSDLNENRSVLL
ncbi:hypothetical protein V3C99_010598 [Haemonchus contortus]